MEAPASSALISKGTSDLESGDLVPLNLRQPSLRFMSNYTVSASIRRFPSSDFWDLGHWGLMVTKFQPQRKGSQATLTLPTALGLDCLGKLSGSWRLRPKPFRSAPLGSSWQVPWSVAPCASCHLPVVDCEDVLDHFTNDCLPTRRGRSLPSFDFSLEFLPYLLISLFFVHSTCSTRASLHPFPYFRAAFAFLFSND